MGVYNLAHRKARPCETDHVLRSAMEEAEEQRKPLLLFQDKDRPISKRLLGASARVGEVITIIVVVVFVFFNFINGAPGYLRRFHRQVRFQARPSHDPTHHFPTSVRPFARLARRREQRSQVRSLHHTSS